MRIDKEYKFTVSLSNESFIDKIICGAMIGSTKNEENRKIRKQYNFKSNVGISYFENDVNCEMLLDKLINGHVICHLFKPSQRRKDGSFGSNQKNNANFIGSYVIGVDIDNTQYNTVEEYIDKLSLKPTLYYTSYSNKQPNKGARFRLIYVFDKLIKNFIYFRYLSYSLNQIIINDVNEEIDDTCNLRCSQYFNGTNINNPNLVVKYGCTNIIYSFNDLGISKDNFIDYLKHNCYYKTNSYKSIINKILNRLQSTTYYNKTENDTLEENHCESESNLIYDENLINDMVRLDYDEFMKYNRHKYNYYYRVEKSSWINNLYQVVDDTYFALPFSYGKNAILHDGQHRRKKVFMRMCLRRVMNPNADANTILFNAYEDIHKFFDWDGLDLGEFLKRNIEYCFSKSIEEIENEFSDTLEYLRTTSKPKRGIIYKNRKAHTKETTYLILDTYYNTTLSVKENIEILYNYGYAFNKTTIYDYLNNRNIPISNNKLNDDELMKIIDVSLTAKDNYLKLKELGFKIGNKRINKIYKLIK